MATNNECYLRAMTFQNIEDAAFAYGTTAKVLLQLGASEELPIYTVPNAKWRLDAAFVQKVEVSPLGPDYYVGGGEVTGPALTLLLLKVAPLNLKNYLCYPDDAKIDFFQADGLRVGATALLTPIPECSILVRDCFLVVKPGELEKCLPKRPKPAMPSKFVVEEPKARDAKADMQKADTQSPRVPETQTKASRTTKSASQQDYLRRAEVAAMLSVSQNTVRNYEKNRGFPASIKLSERAVVWMREDVIAWVKNRQK
jgi:predicted DNA-binding transcriptional regulator AlpA